MNFLSIRRYDLDWKNICAICTDGAPAMLGCRSGFQTRVIKLVNCIKRSALNMRLFRELSKQFDASSENLLFHIFSRLNLLNPSMQGK